MNESVDYQIELHLKSLEDELKSAEQQYLQKLQSIVAKYTKRATQLRLQSLKQYEKQLDDTVNQDQTSLSKPESPALSIQTQTTTIKEKAQQTSMTSIVNKEEKSINTSSSKQEEIEIASPIQQSGYTPTYVKKIRQSLKRGQMLYQINCNNDKENNNNNNNRIDKNSMKLNTSNNTIMTNQAVNEQNEDDDDNDDDLNIIPLNTWSRKYQANCDTNNDSFNMKMTQVEPSNDSSFVSTSPMQLHKYDEMSYSISESSNITHPTMRESCVMSNTMKYAQPNGKPQFQKQLMVNRLRRKRKFDHISNPNHDNMDNNEPPKKKTNIKNIDLMSSRDLKNEIKRIHKTKGNNSKLTRKNLLLKKSVQKLSTTTSDKRQQNINRIDPKNRIKKVMKTVFNSDTESDDDDLLIYRKRKQ